MEHCPTTHDCVLDVRVVSEHHIIHDDGVDDLKWHDTARWHHTIPIAVDVSFAMQREPMKTYHYVKQSKCARQPYI